MSIFQMNWRPNLATLGEQLAAQFAELSKRPCADKCDRVVRELAEAATAVRQLRTDLLRGETRSSD